MTIEWVSCSVFCIQIRIRDAKRVSKVSPTIFETPDRRCVVIWCIYILITYVVLTVQYSPWYTIFGYYGNYTRVPLGVSPTSKRYIYEIEDYILLNLRIGFWGSRTFGDFIKVINFDVFTKWVWGSTCERQPTPSLHVSTIKLAIQSIISSKNCDGCVTLFCHLTIDGKVYIMFMKLMWDSIHVGVFLLEVM